MTDFALHETLAADTVEAARWPLCRVRLMNDSRYPWLILVPARAGMTEIHGLDANDQLLLMTEIDRASRALVALYAPDKINVAALGNMVPQLHVHIVARFRTDDAWPGPVWGARPPIPYGEAELNAALQSLRPVLDHVEKAD
ncbi:MAG: HIT family protein [Alphaproteobacteria bacterium]